MKLKSWLGPTVPHLNINLISCFLRYSWLARPAFNTATFMSSSVWFGWLKWAGTGRSFLPLMISLRCSRNLRPVLVHDKHLYFNNKTSSAPSSSINALKWLPDGSSLRIEFKISFEWSLNLSISPRRQLHLRSNNMITMRWKWLEMPLLFSFRYLC